MRKRNLLFVMILSTFLFSACQKSDSNSTTESTEQASDKMSSLSSSSMSLSRTSSTSTTSENKNNSTDQENDTQNTLSSEELAVALFLSSNLQNRSMDAAITEQINAYEEDTGSSSKIQLSKRMLPDMIVSFSSMGSTQRVHFEEDFLTVTAYSNSGDESVEKYSKKELNREFGKYKNRLAILSEKAEAYSPLEESSGATENSSDAAVDTKKLTSQQFKDWVSAVLDKQFSLERTSFPYDLFLENHEGYAYIRVKHSELQVDTITMFRINNEGQLEEEDKSNGYPVSYRVMSSKFMDTSDVSVIRY
ncbi:hypothetical protein [Enterococcus sp. DIV0187]|uniref:hypothetical protein n=1 Tax=Enterococcus sp. DIV0187 TaxID=2774644 RepID=UPI003F222B04